jgi:hypothetical protein
MSGNRSSVQENIPIRSGRFKDACNHYFDKVKEQKTENSEE